MPPIILLEADDAQYASSYSSCRDGSITICLYCFGSDGDAGTKTQDFNGRATILLHCTKICNAPLIYGTSSSHWLAAFQMLMSSFSHRLQSMWLMKMFSEGNSRLPLHAVLYILPLNGLLSSYSTIPAGKPWVGWNCQSLRVALFWNPCKLVALSMTLHR